jgi:hypothetical protein
MVGDLGCLQGLLKFSRKLKVEWGWIENFLCCIENKYEKNLARSRARLCARLQQHITITLLTYSPLSKYFVGGLDLIARKAKEVAHTSASNRQHRLITYVCGVKLRAQTCYSGDVAAQVQYSFGCIVWRGRNEKKKKKNSRAEPSSAPRENLHRYISHTWQVCMHKHTVHLPGQL